MALTAARIHVAACTEPGRGATHDDAFVADASLGLCAVADGMDGHAGGEVASHLAVEMITRAAAGAPDAAFLVEPSLPNRQRLLGWLFHTMAAVNGALHARARAEPSLAGMGTTLDVALVRGQSVFLAHVGHGRMYVQRGDELYGLTDDHTLGRALAARGAEGAAVHPERDQLVRALGVYPDVQVDVAYYELAPGDVLLLCTHGLHASVPAERIREILGARSDDAPDLLVQAARAAGARRDLTAVTFRVEPEALALAPVIGSEGARVAMARSRLFADFTVGEVLRVQRVAVPMALSPGDTLLAQGEVPDAFHLVLEGRLSAWVDGQPLGFINQYDTCGEYALVNEPSVSSLRADVPTHVLRFAQADILALMAGDPALAAKLAFATISRFTARVQGLASALARHRARERQGA